jgi:glyoxylase-like metal-dependent hydrolase (beta-lactamase superfamily II)
VHLGVDLARLRGGSDMRGGTGAVTSTSATTAMASSGSGGATSAVAVQTYTASGDPPGGVAVNSHLVLGKTEAVLVDGQLYKVDAEKVVSMIQASGKALKTVFLTHAHPDHYMGFAVIRDAFPAASFVTTAAVLADFRPAKALP